MQHHQLFDSCIASTIMSGNNPIYWTNIDAKSLQKWLEDPRVPRALAHKQDLSMMMNGKDDPPKLIRFNDFDNMKQYATQLLSVIKASEKFDEIDEEDLNSCTDTAFDYLHTVNDFRVMWTNEYVPLTVQEFTDKICENFGITRTDFENGNYTRTAMAIHLLIPSDAQHFTGSGQNSGDSTNPTCAICEKTASSYCSACKQVWYCSRKCQKIHWKDIHNQTCEGRNNNNN